MVDLHIHSVFSDGTFTPEELVEQGKALGLKAMSLTDHDTMAGVPRFLEAVSGTPGLSGFTGVELSVEVSSGTMHMLGYGLDPGHPELAEALCMAREGRRGRNQRILARLNELGMPLEWKEVQSLAGDEVVGRPHFAQAMIQRGYVHNKQSAFDAYLAKGAPAYVDRYRLAPGDAIRIIRAAGGLPFLAHPVTLGLDTQALAERIGELVSVGLAGVEVYYCEHSADYAGFLLNLTRRYGILASGGSDFHGAANPALKLGSGFGNLRVPLRVAEQLSAALCRAT